MKITGHQRHNGDIVPEKESTDIAAGSMRKNNGKEETHALSYTVRTR
jgi:hypothetical protein